MFSQNLRLAIRGLSKHLSLSLINILGLSVAISIFLLCLIYVFYEISFDRFHRNYDRIVRIEQNYGNRDIFISVLPNGLAERLESDFTGFEFITRIQNLYEAGFEYEDHAPVSLDQGFYTDTAFFSVFSFDSWRGDPVQALSKPGVIVLTRESANKLFGNEEALGKNIRWNDRFLEVGAVVKTPPVNTHLQFDFLISLGSLDEESRNSLRRMNILHYCCVNQASQIPELNANIKEKLKDYIAPDYASTLYLKPLSEIHFADSTLGDFGPVGSKNNLYSLGITGFFILLMAVFNYVNFATGRNLNRTREIALKKVLGSGKTSIMKQFIVESFCMIQFSLMLGLILFALFINEFNQLINREFVFGDIFHPMFLTILLVLLAIITLVSGAYPAMMIYRIRPGISLKSQSLNLSKKNSIFRRTLVVFQFGVSSALIIIMSTIFLQMQFIKHQDLGYQPDNIMMVYLNNSSSNQARFNTFRNEILKNPVFKSISLSAYAPDFQGRFYASGYEGGAADDLVYLAANNIDSHYLETYGMKIIQGSNFHQDILERDSLTDCIINEAAMKAFGWDYAVGKVIGARNRVIGVVKDFNYAHLSETINPMILHPLLLRSPSFQNREYVFSIRYAGNEKHALDYLKNVYAKVFDAELSGYSFMEDRLENLYRDENRLIKSSAYLSFIAILISSLGLFALIMFVLLQSTREIGIRKTLGASLISINNLFAKDLIKWVLVSFIWSFPLSLWIMKNWLEDYAYHISFPWTTLLISATITIFIALSSTFFQIRKAAGANPVESLRYE